MTDGGGSAQSAQPTPPPLGTNPPPPPASGLAGGACPRQYLQLLHALPRLPQAEFCTKTLAYPSSVFDFKKGYIEAVQDTGIPQNSVDLIMSNCVINLSPDKEAVINGLCKPWRGRLALQSVDDCQTRLLIVACLGIGTLRVMLHDGALHVRRHDGV